MIRLTDDIDKDHTVIVFPHWVGILFGKFLEIIGASIAYIIIFFALIPAGFLIWWGMSILFSK